MAAKTVLGPVGLNRRFRLIVTAIGNWTALRSCLSIVVWEGSGPPGCGSFQIADPGEGGRRAAVSRPQASRPMNGGHVIFTDASGNRR